MILSQKQIEEIAAAVTEDFNKFFFGTESEEVRMARATPIDQFARDYLGFPPRRTAADSGRRAGQRNPRRKKPNDYGTGIPYHEVEALARVLLPEIQAFFESEDGQREYAEWKAKQQAEQENKV